MNVLNIGTDRTLVGGKKLGDAIERHRSYGKFLAHLDIIVYTNKEEHLKRFQISENVIGYPTDSISKLFFIFDVLKIFKKINQSHKVDIVVCQDPFLPALAGYLIKKKYQVKLQLNFHGDFWQNPAWLKERWLNIFFLLISKFTVPQADLIRVMSQGQKEKLIKFGIKENKIKVISTPVNLEKYINFVPKAKIDNSRMVLHVSRYHPVKDFKTLGKAWRLIKEKFEQVYLVQVGGEEKAKEEIDSPEVKILPLTDQQSLIQFYYEADVVVLSSVSESFGKVLVEANACGKPVVATATTGAKEIVQDGYNGFLVPVGNYKRLAERIIYLLEHPNEAKKMGENGRELMKEKFGDNTQKIINAWKELIGGKSGVHYV